MLQCSPTWLSTLPMALGQEPSAAFLEPQAQLLPSTGRGEKTRRLC